MHRIASTLTIGFILALTGCPGDDSSTTAVGASDTTAADSTTTTTTTTTSTGADSTAATPDPMTTTMEMTTAATTAMTTAMTTEMTTDATMGATTDPTGGGGNICDPDPMDDMCVACVKMNCCPQLEACEMDGDENMGCACFQACVAEGGQPVGECDGQCGVNVFDMGSPTGALGGCTLGMCAAECPLG